MKIRSHANRISEKGEPDGYSPDLASSKYHLFTKMKFSLATQRFKTKEDLMDGVKKRLYNLAARCFDEGLQKTSVTAGQLPE